MLSMIVAIPTIAIFAILCTSPSWVGGMIRGNRDLPRIGGGWFTRGAVRTWLFWFITSTIGMVVAGAAIQAGRTGLAPFAWTLAALPFFAAAQFLAFRIGYLMGDAMLRRRAQRRGQRNEWAHGAWQARQAVDAYGQSQPVVGPPQEQLPR